MLTTLLSALCALSLNVSEAIVPTTSTAPADTTTRYSIDGKVVADFDGSQLVGKTVKSYQIEILKGKKEVIKLHNITTMRIRIPEAPTVFAADSVDFKIVTSGMMQSIQTDGESPKIIIKSTTGTAPNMVYVLDGKIISANEFQKIKPADIVSMEIIKDNSFEIKKKYTDKEDAGVILITSKNAK